MIYHVTKKHAPSTSKLSAVCSSEMDNGRHKVFNFQMSKLDIKIINEKLEEVFNKLDSAAKIDIALGFVLLNIERENIGFTTHPKTIVCSKNRIY